MTSEQDLDRVIDTAAAGMIGREPSRALGHAVMARLGQSEERVPRRLIWAGAGVGAAACLLAGLAMLERTQPPAIQTQAPPAVAVVDPLTATVHPSELSRQSVRPAVRPVTRRAPGASVPSDDLLSSIEPITTEPLALPSIELPSLESEGTSVERIDIEALTIEPLTASND